MLISPRATILLVMATASFQFAHAVLEPEIVLLDTNDSLQGVSIAGDPLGRWVVVTCIVNDIHVARSTDNGATWTTPGLLLPSPNTAFDRRPAIARSGNTWVTVWDQTNPPTDRRLAASRSTDAGATWSSQIDAYVNSANVIWRPAIAAGPNGVFVAIFFRLQPLSGGSSPPHTGALVAVVSTDGGLTWNAPTTVHSLAWINSPILLHPNASLATNGQGTWVAAWSSNNDAGTGMGSLTYLYVTRSTNNGATWDTPQLIAGRGMGSFRPDVTHAGEDGWIVVFSWDNDLGGAIGTDDDILLIRSLDNALTWSAPQVLNTNANMDDNHDLEPVVTYDGAGRLIAGWHRDGPPTRHAAVAMSADGGHTWTDPIQSDLLAGIPINGHIASNGVGAWIYAYETFSPHHIRLAMEFNPPVLELPAIGGKVLLIGAILVAIPGIGLALWNARRRTRASSSMHGS